MTSLRPEVTKTVISTISDIMAGHGTLTRRALICEPSEYGIKYHQKLFGTIIRRRTIVL